MSCFPSFSEAMQKFTEAKQSEGEVLKDNTQPPKSAYPKKEITNKKEELPTEPDSRQSPVGEAQKEKKQNTASAEVANNGEHTFNHNKTSPSFGNFRAVRAKRKKGAHSFSKGEHLLTEVLFARGPVSLFDRVYKWMSEHVGIPAHVGEPSCVGGEGGAKRFVLVTPDILHSGLNCVVVSCFGLGTFFCSEKNKKKNDLK